ncbi:hypothetical protein NQ315_009579 [Exocentrus adspersus]|uniref:CHK kinase-like domain-containing protein n=1 Tax=Exocentrus adspersus TaxID=1586481 RepID=A0AAV8WHL6_9CUCU|nr:hypothetical protein NQ315_009579 [Exocentrus adspersus]
MLTPEDCKKVLFKFDKSAKYVSYDIRKISEKVLGFLAEHFYVTITYSKNDQSELQSHRFFLKTVPKGNQTQKTYVEKMGIFKKEILNYKNFLSAFSQLTSAPCAAKYYFSQNEEYLVIEDLSLRNYQVCTLEYLDEKKCAGALQAVARLHAGSLIYEETRSTKEKPYRINEHFTDELIESTFSFKEGHVRNMWCHTATKCLENLSVFFTSDPAAVAQKVRNYIFSEDGLKKKLRPSPTYRNTVCHDDLWRNNMMFNDQNECLLLDFQLTRYTPPALDVLLLLYLGTESNFLVENMDYFLDLYYNCLNYELSRHGLNIEDIISRNEFLASVEEYTLPALVEACMYGTNVYLPEDVSTEVISSPETFLEFTVRDRPSFVVKEFEKNQKYNDRYSNVLKPFFEIMENV